jgi:hypothetical protein
MAEVKECPRCRGTFVIPIEHGMPGAELIERARRGEAAMGGCVVFDDAPSHRCRACGYEW